VSSIVSDVQYLFASFFDGAAIFFGPFLSPPWNWDVLKFPPPKWIAPDFYSVYFLSAQLFFPPTSHPPTRPQGHGGRQCGFFSLKKTCFSFWASVFLSLILSDLYPRPFCLTPCRSSNLTLTPVHNGGFFWNLTADFPSFQDLLLCPVLVFPLRASKVVGSGFMVPPTRPLDLQAARGSSLVLFLSTKPPRFSWCLLVFSCFKFPLSAPPLQNPGFPPDKFLSTVAPPVY